MATRLRTLGWSTWIMSFIVVLVILLTGVLYLAE